MITPIATPTGILMPAKTEVVAATAGAPGGAGLMGGGTGVNCPLDNLVNISK